MYTAVIGRMKYKELKLLIRSWEDTTRLRYVGFVGGEVGAFLVDKDYNAQAIEILTFEGSLSPTI